MATDLTELLRDHARFVEARCPDGETVAADMLAAADEIERLLEAGRYLVTALYGASDKGGWTRNQILAVAKDACERWPELDPRKARDDA